MRPFGPLFEGRSEACEALAALTSALQQRHRGAVRAVLFYGSCMRSGDLYDGLVDLYVIVDRYRRAHHRLLAAIANLLLPPNVYYLETAAGGRAVRAKYAVLSIAQLERGTSRRWFQSYLWGRFCQPVAVAFHTDEKILALVRAALRRSALTFLERSLPLAPPRGRVLELWESGLALSYGTELRAEGGKRPATLVEYGADHFLAATREAAPELRHTLQLSGEDRQTYAASIAPATRRLARVAWSLRKLQGKLLSVLRLLKALFTFDAGFDYIAWKLERHSGRKVEIPERVRRYPLIFVWGLMWKLYREGIFR